MRGLIRPRQFIQNEFQGKLSDEEKAQLRRDALKAICSWRDAGCPPPEPLSAELIRETMDWIACEHIPDDYAAMYIEEMDLAGNNPRAIDLQRKPNSPQDFSVIIIGCGEAGLLAGIRLKEAGIPFEILEKNHDVGGTWLENTYPGCRVDVSSHYYSYSFERNDYFSEYYAQQPELHRYFLELFDEHGIGEHVRVAMRSAAGGLGRRRGAMARHRVWSRRRRADPLCECGDLRRRDPEPALHSRTPQPRQIRRTGVSFRRMGPFGRRDGKRVALIGAGASGFQIGPAIVDDVAQLTVFQRTPQWMAPNPRYHAAVQPGEQWAMRHLPGYSRWYRFMLMWQSNDKLLELVRADPQWADFPHTANAESAARRELFAGWIETTTRR